MVKKEEENVDDVDMSDVEQDGGKKKKAAKKSGSKSAKKSGSKSAKKAPAKKSGSKSAKKSGSKSAKKSGSKSQRGGRCFRVLDAKTGESYGRYTGKTPKQAASKSFTKTLKRLQKAGKKPEGKMTIYLRESTRGSNKKVYGYSASRRKLDKAQEFTIKGEDGEEKTITYKFRNDIHKVAVPEALSGGAKKRAAEKKAAAKKAAKKSGSKSAKKGSKGSKGHRGGAAKKSGSKSAKKSGSKPAKKSAKPAKKSGSKSAKKHGKK